MQTHSIQQGTESWHQFRSSHFGASEASAMLGISKQLSRNDLLLYKKTGKSKEYSDWVQKNILDYGHEVELKAREILEQEIQEDLFPVTCSDENSEMSASCDGLTFDGMTAFEHKQFSKDLYENVQNGNPGFHMAQCQQILLVTGAEKLIFVCSDGTKEKWAQISIHPDESWFKRIRDGWSQFKSDLEIYQQMELVDKPEPQAIMQLPSLSIQIKGEVIASNLPQFKKAAETFISGINTDLKTDDDFANAEETIKFCEEIEKKLESVKAAVIGQTSDIDESIRTINYIKESIGSKRLTLNKAVKRQKELVKKNIIDDAYEQCAVHQSRIASEFQSISFPALANLSRQSFETACKDKRTLKSLHNAVDTEVASIKIKLDDMARVIRKNIAHLPEDLSLFRDIQSIITKPEDDFKLLVESRLTEQKRKEEDLKKQAIEAEKTKAQSVSERENTVIKPVTTQQKESYELLSNKQKIHSEIAQSLVDNKIAKDVARNVVELMISGKIKHVTINYA
ncbi:hypothetical protein W03_09610 [Nitrosomonas sp. PY1]|nr:hypothetical protein W03_09610 [Nitrosomonas sp. PY1]